MVTLYHGTTTAFEVPDLRKTFQCSFHTERALSFLGKGEVVS